MIVYLGTRTPEGARVRKLVVAPNGQVVQNVELVPVTDDCVPACKEFDWGNHSMGSYLLAASVLCDFLGKSRGLRHLNRFREEVTDTLFREGWALEDTYLIHHLASFEREDVL